MRETLVHVLNSGMVENCIWSWIALAILTFILLSSFKVKAPYGRHVSKSWGPTVSNNWGWLIMELPAVFTFPLLVLLGPNKIGLYSGILIALWLFHYIYRTFFFPFKLKTAGKKIPVIVVLSALVFNLINGCVIGYSIGWVENDSTLILGFAALGLALFIVGTVINRKSDNYLINLRRSNTEYQIPNNGLFEYISCPNHFGEIIQWLGFALIAQNLGAASFAVWTCSNLIPRALNHHTWYKEHFSDYPKERKAVLPFIL